jgi:hypothetical protein
MLMDEDQPSRGLKWLWTGLVALAVIFMGYQIWIEKTSAIRFSIGQVVGVYSDSKNYGKKIKYLVDGKEYITTCVDQKCKQAQIGARFLIHYYVKDPDICFLYLNKPVKPDLIAPYDGWGEEPPIISTK